MDKQMSFFQKIFSIKEISDSNKKRKIIRIFGIKFSTSKEHTKEFYLNLQKKYAKREQEIKNKKVINIVFMVSLVSMFPARPLFEYCLKHADRYNAKILIIPDLRFGIENAEKSQEEAYSELLNQYGKDNLIVCPIDESQDTLDIKQIADIVIPALPYNDISHPKYNLCNLVSLGILPALVNYGYFRSKYDRTLISSGTYSMYWKIFIENNYNFQEYKKYQKINGANCVLTGYCKMDLYKPKKQKKDKNVIMIAPHHSVKGGYNDILALSNFYKYAEFFLELPKLYSDIDFIFRPHPALFFCLEKKEFWGREKVEKYIKAMKSIKNVRYSEGGNYLDDFAESDALIQDCGSFLVDYFYTKKPQCYMLKNIEQIDETFSDFGKDCLDNVYKAFEKEDIINFINDIVISGNDFMKEKREKFSESEVMINYPNAADVIGNHFNKIFGE